MIDIKRAILNKKVVTFQFYKDGELWYATEFNEEFPVPIEDIGNATFLNVDKASLFMRYMRMWNKKVSTNEE